MEFVGYVATVIVLFCLGVFALSTVPPIFRQKAKAARIAGTVIPELGEGIDISKRFDIVYSGGDYGGTFTERVIAVRILGYVGRQDDESVSKMHMRGRWLVIEFTDLRRGYLMPHSIVSLQETPQV